MSADRTMLAIVGVVAAILQLLLAPALTFGDAMPSFIVVAAFAVMVLFPDERHYVFAFVMGIVADLVGQSPVGSTAFCLLVCSFALPMIVEAVGNENPFMAALLIFAGILVMQVLFCIFLAVFGILGFIDGLAHVAIPCAIYDAVITFIVYLVGFRFGGGRSSGGSSGMTMQNIRFN
ncbi:MAG: rod shape-determining protein MreD [Coriobacteriaceae bacterium]|nr:rod shape-determining protein MreD [Coriobacteriaceae bacterium]